MEDRFKEEINKTFPDVPKAKLKAYEISDKNCDADGQIIVWAESSGLAKSQGLRNEIFYDCDYTELRAERLKSFDKYAETKIPIKELLNMGWWFCCAKCGLEGLGQNNIDNGEAFVWDENKLRDFVKGNIICKDCKELLEVNNV